MVEGKIIRSIPPFIAFWFLADFALAGTYILNDILNSPLGINFTNLIDVAKEQNLPTWYSSIQLFVVASFFLIAARAVKVCGKRGFRLFLTLGLIFLFLSLDENTGIHEKLGRMTDVLLPGGDRATTFFSSTGIWMFVFGIPALVLLSILILLMGRYTRSPRIVKLCFWGTVIFIGSAAGIEILANYEWGRELEHFVEELGEMVGVTIVLWGVYELVSEVGVPIENIGASESGFEKRSAG